jgi:hypothetical protein
LQLTVLLHPFLINGIPALVFNDPARVSTLLLTSLMVIGLVFFIRASTKDRIEVVQFESAQAVEPLREAILKYFYSRAYQLPDADSIANSALAAVSPADQKNDEKSAKKIAKKLGPTIVGGTTLVGMVSPSLFLAIFLSGLAAVGLACLALIMATLFPAFGAGWMALLAIAPLAGLFYWQKSSRPETIVLKVEPLAIASEGSAIASNPSTALLTVKGHRDELAILEEALAEPELQAWAAFKKRDIAA